MIELTPRAEEILRRAHSAAKRFNPEVTIRVVRSGEEIQFVLAEGSADGDTLVSAPDIALAVEAGLEGIVAVVEPHDRLVLRPPGSGPLPGEVLEADGH